MNETVSSPAIVIMVGAGGLGVAVAHALAQQEEQQVKLRIIDYDTVERSNLNRQYAYTEADCGSPKAAVLLAWLQQHFPDRCRTWEAVQAKIEADSAADLLASAALIIDASDAAATKFLLNDFARTQGIALCHGAASGNRGQALLVLPDRGSPCLRCVFGDAEESEANCQSAGILGAFVGALALLQTELSLAFLAGRPDTRLFSLELAPLRQRAMQCAPLADCRCQRQGSLLSSLPSPANISTAESVHVEARSELPVRTKKLDLRDKCCPETFLYTKLAFEQLDTGIALEVQYADHETREQVRKSLALEGIVAVPLRGEEGRREEDCALTLLEKGNQR